MDYAALVVVALLVLLVGGYAVGGVLNVRRMQVLVAGLRDVMSGPGGPPRVRRLRHSIVRLEADRPVRGTGATVATVLVAPREALLVWLVWSLQGRGDLLDVKAELDAAPAGAGLVADPRHRTGRAALAAAVAAGGTRRDLPGRGLAMVTYDAAGAAAMERVSAVAEEAGDLVVLELRGAPSPVSRCSCRSGTHRGRCQLCDLRCRRWSAPPWHGRGRPAPHGDGRTRRAPARAAKRWYGPAERRDDRRSG